MYLTTYGCRFKERPSWCSGPALTCRVCGRQTWAMRRDDRRKYCGPACCAYAAAQRQRAREIAARRKTCITCGKAFEANRNDARFCGNACRQKHYRVTANTCGKFATTGRRNVVVGSSTVDVTGNTSAKVGGTDKRSTVAESSTAKVTATGCANFGTSDMCNAPKVLFATGVTDKAPRQLWHGGLCVSEVNNG